MNRHANWLRLAFALATAALSTAAQPAVEIVCVGIPGKLDNFSPFYVRVKTGVYRNERQGGKQRQGTESI
jgi:hypothetical protein